MELKLYIILSYIFMFGVLIGGDKKEFIWFVVYLLAPITAPFYLGVKLAFND